MKLDDPTKPEFASWDSYLNFVRSVKRDRRYVWGREVQAFLDTVLVTLKGRDVTIKKDTILYRAQRGVEYLDVKDDDGAPVGEDIIGLDGKRMKPLADRAKEGRVNPAGIPILYLASSEETAISEVRPWVGSEVSVAQFKILRDLRAVNLSLGHGQFSLGHLTFDELSSAEGPNADKKEKVVWTDIDSAFSQPTTLSDDTADYVPTQILAELFRNAQYDALIYRSHFGEKGYNVALFNTDDAEPINCAPYQVKGVKVSYEEIGNRWYSTKQQKSKK